MNRHNLLPLQYQFAPLDALGVTAADLDFLDSLQIQWTLDGEPLPTWDLENDQTFLRACGIAAPEELWERL
jgi:hypothetical protein